MRSVTRLWAFASFVVFLTAPAKAQTFDGAMYPVGLGPVSVDTGDLNSDGRLDLVATGPSPSGVFVLLGTPGGGFIPAGAIAVGQLPKAVVLADMNLDGVLDVVTANFASTDASVRLGTGTGSFTGGSDTPAGQRPVALDVGDLDGDGKPDVVVANQVASGTFTTLLGDGTGGLSFAAAFAVGANPVGIELRDLNNDGHLDAITCNSTSKDATVCLGLGNGGFGASSTVIVVSSPPPPPPSLLPSWIECGDVNLDGKLDAAVMFLAQTAYPVSILPGNGSGGFGAPVLLSGFSGAHRAASLEDVDLDGVPDLVFTASSAYVFVYRGLANASFFYIGAFPAGLDPRGLRVRDYDGDGIPDVATANSGSGTVSVLRGSGGGKLIVPLSYSTTTSTGLLAAGDVNGDGFPDLVSSSSLGSVWARLGDGAGGLQSPITTFTGYKPGRPTLADLNGDGWLDFVVPIFGAPGGPFGVEAYLGTGDGRYTHGQQFALNGACIDVALGDLNGDGVVDAVSAVHSPSGIATLLGNAGGIFSAPSYTAIGADASAVRLGDVDLDGDLDAIAVQSGNVVVLKGDSLGNFGVPTPFPGPASPKPPTLADVSGDGALDVVIPDGSSNVTILQGNGSGDFATSTSVSMVASTNAAIWTDVTCDGIPDLVTASVFVRPGSGSGTLGPAMGFGIGFPAYGIVAADFTGDGAVDLMVEGSGTTFLQNRTMAPAGTSTFGVGTHGCSGVLGIHASSVPIVGNAAFALTCTDAPTSSLGLGIVADTASVAGNDPFGLGLSLHVDLTTATFVAGLTFVSDPSGTGAAPLPIPALPSLAGAALYAQAIWIENASEGLHCSQAVLGLVSSKGLAFTIAP